MKRWFSEISLKVKEASPEPPPQHSKEYISLALNSLYHCLSPGQKYNILDLGPAMGANVDFFSQFPAKMYIEDFYHTLTSFDFLSPEDGVSYQTVFDYLLPYSPSTSFDVIMSWDIFNYLEREEYKSLIGHISQFCHPSTLVFALISTSKYIPEKPNTFRILDQEHIIYQFNSNVLRPCPQYQSTDLTELMPNFRVCNSFLLRNGFKEYLFANSTP